MACTGNRRRKEAVRSGQRTNQASAVQQDAAATISPAETLPIPPICTVVDSVKLPISSVPALLNPSNNVQLLSTPQLTPTIRFGELQVNLQTLIRELQESEIGFHEEVATINATDRLIFQNASFLECLYRYLQELGETGKKVDADLEKVFSELNTLEETVSSLEKRIDGNASHRIGCHDGKQRENLFNCIVQLDANMNHLVAQLSDVICLNNSLETGSCLQTNPVHQVGCILNHNYEALVHFEKVVIESKVQMDRLSSLQKESLRRIMPK